MVRNNLSLTSSVVIGLCSDHSASKEEMSQFIAAGADTFWIKLQEDPKQCIKEILEKWLSRNVRLNTNDTNINQVVEDLIKLLVT